MYGTDPAYQSQKPAGHAEHEHVHAHHLSPWAIFLGFTVPILAVGIVTGGGDAYGVGGDVILIVGGLLVAFGVFGWMREDYLEFPKGPNPLTHHTQGKMDNGWWGIVLFLVTEVILFGSIFGIWFSARAGSELGWAPAGTPGHGLPIGPTGINTAILVASGFVMMWGEKGLLKGNRKRFVLGFLGAILLGSIFLAGQVLEYQNLWHEGFKLDTNIYTTVFYALTGTHGFHVFGGLVFLTIVLIRGALGNFDGKRHIAVQAAAYYWHFVDIVWLFLYMVVYLEWI